MPPPSLQLDVQRASRAQNLPSTAQLRRWVAMACEHPAAITLRIVGAAEGLRLNESYRGKAYATNVLTFNYAVQPLTVADVVLCAPVVAREAKEQGKPLAHHWAHLVVHGCLHAQGYDHEGSAREAHTMEALEVLILGALGVPNPYGD
jgi:probable rRNA maturation factor